MSLQRQNSAIEPKRGLTLGKIKFYFDMINILFQNDLR